MELFMDSPDIIPPPLRNVHPQCVVNHQVQLGAPHCALLGLARDWRKPFVNRCGAFIVFSLGQTPPVFRPSSCRALLV
ncbi:hypothetical protein BIY45_01025 [Stenotrophomonas sp. BIIR7]|nr:hypothetical protein BIY45_01025 [Stenotrophomonas sp. BIIR7]